MAVFRSVGNGKIDSYGTLEKLFDTPFLNGDLNLIGKEGDQFVVYGIPWCGTSEIFTVEKKELGGIVLLEKAPEDKIVSLTKEQKTLPCDAADDLAALDGRADEKESCFCGRNCK